MLDFREDFPYLKNNLIYFDNAATSQKPIQVIDAISHFYAHENAPVHRAMYKRAEVITDKYENARKDVAKFIGAKSNEIVFTKGTTEGINFIADTWGEDHLKKGDEIILTDLEHHANLLPWMRLAQKKHLTIKYIPITPDYQFNYDAYLKLLSDKTKLVAFVNDSNSITTEIDAKFIVEHAKKVNAKILIDAAQFIPHRSINLHDLTVAGNAPDFLVFSGHKMLGPTGIGVLYISENMHSQVEPYQLGGGMVFQVRDTTLDCPNAMWLKPPHCYEAGTPPIAQAIGLAEAINYIQTKIDFKKLIKHESALCAQLLESLEKINSIKILGSLDEITKNGHLVSFISNKMHPHDIAAYLDTQNIAVRAGNHCTQPLYIKLGISGSVRVSFYLYNTVEEVDLLVKALTKLL